MLLLSLATFSFFGMNFQMKNVEGNMFDNMMASQLSEIAADFLSGIIFYCVGAKKSFQLSFLVGLIGHILLIQASQLGDHRHMPLFISVAKFGISSAFNICYIASVQLIPTLFAASVFGFCNVMSRSVTAFAPIVVEIGGLTPIIINAGCMFCALLISMLIKENQPKYM